MKADGVLFFHERFTNTGFSARFCYDHTKLSLSDNALPADEQEHSILLEGMASESHIFAQSLQIGESVVIHLYFIIQMTCFILVNVTISLNV